MAVFAHFPDLHFDEKNDFPDTLAAMDHAIEAGKAANVDFWLVTGDLYERRSTAAERWELSTRLLRMSDHAPVFGVRGNHDVPGDVRLLNRLAGSHRIFFAEAPDTQEQPNARLVLLPHVDRGQEVEGLPTGATTKERAAVMLEGAKDLIEDWDTRTDGQTVDDVRPIIVLGHLGVGGSTLSKGEKLSDHAAEVSVEELVDLRADYVALGHIHMVQRFASGRIAYAGSLTRTDRGEEGQQKGWWLVRVEGRNTLPMAKFQTVPLRPMITLVASWGPDGWVMDNDPEGVPKDADVRLRIEAPEDRLAEVEEARAEALEWFKDHFRLSFDVRLERLHRVRSEEMAAAETPKEMLEAYWKATTTPPEDFQAQAFAGLVELEAEVGT